MAYIHDGIVLSHKKNENLTFKTSQIKLKDIKKTSSGQRVKHQVNSLIRRLGGKKNWSHRDLVRVKTQLLTLASRSRCQLGPAALLALQLPADLTQEQPLGSGHPHGGPGWNSRLLLELDPAVATIWE